MLKSTFCANHLKMLISPFLSRTTLLQNNGTDFVYQQTRNGFILKRKFKPPLLKKSEKYRMLRPKYFVYHFVEHTESQKQKPIKLILTSDVHKIGAKGEIVLVSPEKAYNNVILPKLGVYATQENIDKYITKSIDEGPKLSLITKQTINILSHMNLSVSLSQEVPWTLEKWHLKVSFRKAGIYVPEEAITLPEKTISGPDLSLEGKQFYVIVTINNSEKVKVRCRIHHHNVFIQDFWKYLLEPIFPEDKPILDSMPIPRNIQNLE
ncbi:39S ribosomal protein L9, mitochondrial [Vespa crabro]|uniref:39S ribosomal protein L9, mitochondrial n=1 Tax=Vespa crabro TaxID=7445 RepID=UPI001EFFDE94|nr:39S ribosomal protein L9, mitochondrial [Vespa crabro]